MSVYELEVTEIVLKPEAFRPATIPALVMKCPNGELKPGHLPNIYVMHSRVNLEDLKRRLTHVVDCNPGVALRETDFFRLIVDPSPVLSLDRPIWGLDHEDVIVKIGSYTNGLQVFKVMSKLTSIGLSLNRDSVEDDPPRHLHTLKLEPGFAESHGIISIGEKILVWNCRGFTRPSLDQNLKLLIEKFDPVVIILTETMVSGANFYRVFASLKLRWYWEIDQEDILNGGAIILGE